MQTEWRSFQGGAWETEVNVRDFIQKNYHPYDGDDSFLEGPTQDTTDLWDQVLELSRQEREAGGVLDMDTKSLCRPDCAGLCDTCGANLNLGPCSCRKQRDPRLAVLEQLLDKQD